MNTQTTKENKKAENSFVEHIDMAMLPASGSQSAMAAATAAPPVPPPPPPPSSSSTANAERPARPEGFVARHKRSGRRVRAQQEYRALVKAVWRSQATFFRNMAEIHYGGRGWGRGDPGRGGSGRGNPGQGWGRGDPGRGSGRGDPGRGSGRARGDRHS